MVNLVPNMRANVKENWSLLLRMLERNSGSDSSLPGSAVVRHISPEVIFLLLWMYVQNSGGGGSAFLHECF